MNRPLLRDFLAKYPDHKKLLDAAPGLLILDLVEFLCPYGVKVGGIYKHFKGDRYKVLGFVRDSADWEGELHVRYAQVDNVEHEATRPLSEFLGEVERDDYKGPRFILVS